MHIFTADLHLRPGNKEDEEIFLGWLNDFGTKASKIYILGDLFEYWYSGLEPRVSRVLDAIGKNGAAIIAGNRDFLMTSSPGVPGLIKAEEYKISLNGKTYLLAHGHTLTLNDTGFGILHRFGWPVLKFLDRHIKTGPKDRIASMLVSASSAVRPLSAEIRPGICAEKGVDAVICGHLHREMMTENLIVLPAFAEQRAWLEIDDNDARRFASLA